MGQSTLLQTRLPNGIKKGFHCKRWTPFKTWNNPTTLRYIKGALLSYLAKFLSRKSFVCIFEVKRIYWMHFLPHKTLWSQFEIHIVYIHVHVPAVLRLSTHCYISFMAVQLVVENTCKKSECSCGVFNH